MTIFAVISLLLTGLLFAQPVAAVCPVCVVAVGAGVGLSRYLGIDDTVSGVWVGGMVVALSIMTAVWLKKRWPKIKYVLPVSFVVYSLMSVAPFWKSDIVGHSANRLLGIDKLIFGIFTGMIIFVLGVTLDKKLRKRNEGKVYFPYQKVIIPVVTLLLGSLGFYLITRV